jgi:8-oxo-dGTP diphosphatase
MTVVLLRHASAGDRDQWDGDDRLRPVDKKGQRQAQALRDVLLARGVTRALSSPYVRCTQTVAPLGLDIEPDERLAEGADPADTRALLMEADGAVACTHGDVIENVVGFSIKKGAAVVLDGLDVVDRIDAPKG